jgi:hypothetical protein
MLAAGAADRGVDGGYFGCGGDGAALDGVASQAGGFGACGGVAATIESDAAGAARTAGQGSHKRV